MKRVLWGTGAAILLIWACSISLAQAAPRFSDMYVIGDSLSDTGNRAVFAPIFQPDWVPPPYYSDGRATNGRVAVEVLAERLHLEGILENPQLLPAEFLLHSIGGTNYAVGGALAAGDGPIDVAAQATALIAGQPNLPADALAIVFIGSNDVLAVLKAAAGSPGLTQIRDAVLSEIEAIRSLVYAGMGNVLVVEVVDFGMVPKVNLEEAGTATELSVAYNDLLAEEITLLSAGTGARIALYPLFHTFSTMVLSRFPEQNWRIACWSSGACADAEGNLSASVSDYVFLDGIHPTAKVHELIGADMAEYVAIAFAVTAGEDDGSTGEDANNGVGETDGMSVDSSSVGGGGFGVQFLLLMILLSGRSFARIACAVTKM